MQAAQVKIFLKAIRNAGSTDNKAGQILRSLAIMI